MKLKKYILIILLVHLMLFVCIGSVCALENQTYDFGENEVIGSPDESNFNDLQTKIDAADEGGTVNLTNNYTYDDSFSSDGITITKAITINGNGFTINGLNKARIFNINASDHIILNNITFINGKSNLGGAIIFNNAISDSVIENCKFINNNVTRKNTEKANGGAIYAKSTFNNNTIRNTEFISNTAYDNGGAIYINDSATYDKFDSLIFTNNSANNGGAIYFNGGIKNVTINGYFKGNGAERAGGAIFVRGQSRNSTFSSEFYDNRARQASGGGIFFGNLVENNRFESIFKSNFAFYGGGIFLYNKANSNEFISDFINNTAKSCGGAIFFYNTTDKNNFSGSFINNSALGEVSEIVGNGGAITFKDTSSNSIFNSDFINNTANLNGGGVNYRHTPYNITFNSNFINNTSPRGGGVNFFETFENVIFNGDFIGNSAVKGGAIAAVDGIIEGVSFTDNLAEKGGAVYINGTGEVINCIFTNNTATSDYDGGGAVYIGSGDVAGSVFTSNGATSLCGTGGAIFIKNSGDVTDCSFEDNFAEFGGAVATEINGNVNNCDFTANKASVEGGALYIGSGNVKNSNFTNNKASNCDGGAVYINGNVTVINCNFTGNEADMGSAIYYWVVGDSKYLRSISHSTFLNNKANIDPTTPFTFTINETNIEIAFEGNDNLLNAILSRRNADVNITNVTYWGANGVENTGDSTIVPVMSYMEAGQNVTIIGVVNGMPVNARGVTNVEGKVVLDAGSGDYWLSVGHDDDSYYSSAKTVFTNMALNANVTSQTTTNKTVNITAKSNIYSEVMPGKLIFILPNSEEINANYANNGTWWALYTFNDAGDYNVNASYTGLDGVIINNATISIRYDTSVDVNNKTLDLLIDDTFTIVATTTPEGLNVTFTLDNSGVVSVDENGLVTALKEGTASITVKVGGNSKYTENSTNVTVTVSKIPTEISADPTSLDLLIGNESQIVATLTPRDVGNVTFTSNDEDVVTVDTNGNIIAVGKGNATITLSFEGDEKYAAAENKTISVNVKLKDASISIDAPEIIEGENATVTVTLPEDATGNVSIGNESIPVQNATASAVLTNLPVGNTSIPITYSGDDKYNPAMTTVNITVNKNTLNITAEDLTKYYKDSEKFAVTVTDARGQAVSNKTVEITINGVTYNRTTDENGTAKLNINLNSGEYPVSVAVDDIMVNSTVTVKSTIDAADVIKIFRNDTQYYARFIDSNTNILANTSVSFNINGIIYNRTTDGNGTAKLNINLDAGDYIITATNTVTGEMKSNTIKVISLIESNDLTKYYRNASQFVVRIHSAAGGYIGTGENVTFNINGVFYTRTTNATGHAKLNINLGQGNYTITTYYKDCSKGNNIEVLPILIANDLEMKYMDGSLFKAKLVDGQGKAYAGQSVQFNINGVLYNRVTGSDGVAALNINLMAGEYIITSSYNDFNTANKITIRG